MEEVGSYVGGAGVGAGEGGRWSQGKGLGRGSLSRQGGILSFLLSSVCISLIPSLSSQGKNPSGRENKLFLELLFHKGGCLISLNTSHMVVPHNNLIMFLFTHLIKMVLSLYTSDTCEKEIELCWEVHGSIQVWWGQWGDGSLQRRKHPQGVPFSWSFFSFTPEAPKERILPYRDAFFSALIRKQMP